MVQKTSFFYGKKKWIFLLSLSALIFFSISNSLIINEIDISDTFKVSHSDELSIIHLSDIHIKGFENKESIEKLIETVNDLEGDIIVYTGDYGPIEDMKNGYEIFSQLKCKYKKYAVLGNHDYGNKEIASDNWNSEEDKKEMEQQLKALYHQWGVELLLNESDTIQYKDHVIAVLGLKVYDPHHGFYDSDLETAIYGKESIKNKIVLMHNPDLWAEEVVGKYDINLTLAGHTHGAQIGIGIGDYKVSPAQLMFTKWRGLYKKDHELLIVNTGIGNIGMPFRIGMNPEVILVKLPLI